MVIFASLTLAAALVSRPVIAADTAAASPTFDAFSAVLSPEQRALITRDPRCSDAKTITDQFVSGKDAKVGVAAVGALEKCATLSRVGDNWSDYRDYLLLAAGAIAYEVGVLANAPKGYERAIYDASHVSGYQAPQSVTVVLSDGRTVPMVQVEKVEGQGAPKPGGFSNAGTVETNAGLPMQNASADRPHATLHATGYSGPYGALATQVGEAAQRALAERGPRPQAVEPK